MRGGADLKRSFVVGSRGSDLALTQTKLVKAALEAAFPDISFEIEVIKTTGDAIRDVSFAKIGGKGVFTKEIEDALLSSAIDFAVHSLKDLPTSQPDGLMLGAVSAREMPNDAFISGRFDTIDELPEGARIATGSIRRRSQLLNRRPDLEILEIRGNVGTRVEKANSPELDGSILACAGLYRLGMESHIRQVIPTSVMLPAVGQGVLAIEIRADDGEAAAMARELNNDAVEGCIRAERAFLGELEGGCRAPIGALAETREGLIHLAGYVGGYDGAKAIRKSISGAAGDPDGMARALAEKFLRLGAAEILAEARDAEEHSTAGVV